MCSSDLGIVAKVLNTENLVYQKIELSRDDDYNMQYVYDIEVIANGSTEYELDINAVTGLPNFSGCFVRRRQDSSSSLITLKNLEFFSSRTPSALKILISVDFIHAQTLSLPTNAHAPSAEKCET